MSLVVTVYVKVPWRPLRAWVMFTGMEHAFTESCLHHDFERGGRRYRWAEGVLHPAAARFRGRRGELGALFTRTVLPTLLRRGAARAQHPAADDGRAWWVTLRREGEATVWALYVSTRGLSRAVTQTRGAPANDGALLAAWGDGPVLAWCCDEPALRARVRDALRELPPFLAEGVCSADETFAVSVSAA